MHRQGERIHRDWNAKHSVIGASPLLSPSTTSKFLAPISGKLLLKLRAVLLLIQHFCLRKQFYFYKEMGLHLQNTLQRNSDRKGAHNYTLTCTGPSNPFTHRDTSTQMYIMRIHTSFCTTISWLLGTRVLDIVGLQHAHGKKLFCHHARKHRGAWIKGQANATILQNTVIWGTCKRCSP